MWPLVLLWGCLLLPGYGAVLGPKEITAFEGNTVSLQCTYQEELRTHRKYWCKEKGFFLSRCSGIVYVGKNGQETRNDRVSIQDSPQTLTLHVTLRNLTLQDTGKYFCGVSKLGPDETFPVSLLVFPASPGLHQTVTTTKQGKTGAKASPFTGTSPYGHAGTSPDPGTSPYAGTSPHEATSPHAGTSRPFTQLDSTSAEDTHLPPSSSSSMSRVSIPKIRILAPGLVLLALLLAAGLVALGSYLLRWRKEAQLDAETQRNEKVQLSHLTSEEEEAPSQDPEGDMIPGPPLHMSGEELSFSKFISV
ncbi:CMRF35-like molecule 9 isoform X2 [Mirounga angustirostris]|uniref:CMRF35-like molecule 9 isoform X2 n=1 Tax=Mirounga angustirostris TaxID=9716 RepID=UPI001E68E1A8|nr:CMRF35-like molecule 9 isoform X2 [Mirounga angustirostris]